MTRLATRPARPRVSVRMGRIDLGGDFAFGWDVHSAVKLPFPDSCLFLRVVVLLKSEIRKCVRCTPTPRPKKNPEAYGKGQEKGLETFSSDRVSKGPSSPNATDSVLSRRSKGVRASPRIIQAFTALRWSPVWRVAPKEASPQSGSHSPRQLP